MRVHKKLIATLVTLMMVVGGLLVPALPASAAAGTVTLTTLSGAPGATMTVSGTGYLLGGTATVQWQNTSTLVVTILATGIPIAAGNFSTSFVVPGVPRGTYTVSATSSLGDTAGVNATFTVTPAALTLSTYTLQGGQTVYLSGKGFNVTQAVSVYLDSTYLTQVITLSDGTFSNVAINIPNSISGGTSHAIWASDSSGASPYAYITLAAKMTVSTTSVAVGSAVTVSGSSFAQSSLITFYLDGNAIGGNATTDINGAFSNTSVTIPATAGGSHTNRAQDSSGNSDSATFTVTSKATIAPITGPAGTTVNVTGNGFLASTTITVMYNGATISTTSSDSNGNVNATFKTPSGPSNANTVTISDGTNTNTATFTSIATASINPLKGPTGTAVQVTGAGYKASSTVTINYNNATAGSANSDANGNFNVTINMPNAPYGDHTVTISDGTNSINQTFSITPTATMAPLTGFVGTNITVQGSGFTALRGLSVKYDGTDVLSPSPTIDANGSFAASFKTPVSKGGNHTVIITDGVSTMNFTFAMDSTPPSAPQPQLPIANTQADAIPSLKWSDVTDQSAPVTYNLELSSDAAFANLIINRTGLTVSSYTLSPAETLPNRSKEAPYYWRVQAVDAASNVSAWSSPATFFVGFVMATWALYVIFAVVVIAIGILAYWLGRRRAMSM